MGIVARQTPSNVSQPLQRVAVQSTYPASVGGINSLDSLLGMAPTDCIYCHNLMPSEYGMRLRKGYRLWAKNIDNGASVNTVIAYEGQASDASLDRLWAVTEGGIYNVTTPDQDSPTQDVDFTVQNDLAGYGVWTEFTNDASDRFLQYADGANGLHEYAEGTGLWTVPAITGPVVADIAFVTSWKSRLWYIENNSGDAWYLAPNANAGAATKFTFGSKFKHGGELKALYSWTIDGGDGVDDLLVAIGRGGDVLIYSGVDPDVATFTLIGSFFIGEIPETRRIGVNYGGELYLLSTYGLTSVRDLVQGIDPSEPSKSPAAKISRFLRDAVLAGKDALNWALHIHPADGFLQLVGPYDEPSVAIQYNQNLLTRAWGMWRGVPVNCAETWNADYYMGDKVGQLWVYDGALDGATFAGSNVWTDTPVGGAGPEWSQPTALEYACDGTQTAQTAFDVATAEPTIPGRRYLYAYDVTGANGGSHWASYGGSLDAGEKNTGDGTFTGVFQANTAAAVGAVWGDADFAGTFSNVTLRDAGNIGNPIDFDVMTAFQALGGDHASNKRVGFIRPIGFAAGGTSLDVAAVYDYAVQTELPQTPQAVLSGNYEWDAVNSRWNFAEWDYAAQSVARPVGAAGMGRTVAIAMRGSANTRINLIAWDTTYTQGGFL